MEKRLKQAVIKHLKNQKEYLKNPEEPYIAIPAPGKNSWTIDEIIEEVENETEFGENIVEDIIGLTIHTLLRDENRSKGTT